MEKIRSYRQADQLLAVVPWRSWYLLATLGVVLLLVLLWSVYGRVRVTLALPGALVRPAARAVLIAPATGVVERLEAEPGDLLDEGELVAVVRTSAGEAAELRAHGLAGRVQVAAVTVEAGDAVEQGVLLVRTTVPGVPLRAVALAPMASRHHLKPGMEADLEIEGLPASRFGMLRATVRGIGDIPLQPDDIRHLFEDPQLAERLLQQDEPPKALVHLDLLPGEGGRYQWTVEPGPDFRLDSDLDLRAHVILATVPPIRLLDPARR